MKIALLLSASLLAFACPASIMAQSLISRVPNSTVNYIEKRFAAQMQSGGMSAVTADIQDCYDKAILKSGNDPSDLSPCILYDISAYNFDQEMRQAFVGRGSPDPGPVTPFLSDKAFSARVQIYDQTAFPGASEQEILDYYQDGIGKVDNYVGTNGH